MDSSDAEEGVSGLISGVAAVAAGSNHTCGGCDDRGRPVLGGQLLWPTRRRDHGLIAARANGP